MNNAAGAVKRPVFKRGKERNTPGRLPMNFAWPRESSSRNITQSVLD
ncbi:hypothetical protein [Pelotomaculum propionicicum]|nr:hypothetical protein [Pelotomaculum propionicicum]NLI14293.1 hypothetical protein [Peptococcaceae bacterium]